MTRLVPIKVTFEIEANVQVDEIQAERIINSQGRTVLFEEALKAASFDSLFLTVDNALKRSKSISIESFSGKISTKE